MAVEQAETTLTVHSERGELFSHSCSSPSAPVCPAEICGYAIDTALAKYDSDVIDTYLAIGPGGRGVVLKRLEDDCLVSAKAGVRLHPSVKERLSRVRELAHTGVANLHGVERDERGSWTVWDYVEGTSLDTYLAAPGRTTREVALVARELVLTIDSLHMQGIVHGAIKPGNVIVTSTGSVKLTHVSPYLYNDPAEDARAVLTMLEAALAARHEEQTALARVLSAASEPDANPDQTLSLRLLASRLAAHLGSRDGLDLPAGDPQRRSRNAFPRRMSLFGAAVVILIGAAAAYGAWQAVGKPPLSGLKPVPVVDPAR